MSELEIENVRYLESDLEVAEVALAAIAYILEGDELNAPYDLRGLGVFGVIGTLREHDRAFYGPDAVLSADQKQRLARVEGIVDEAVEQDMHYFPFGNKQDRVAIDYDPRTGDADDRQRANAAIGGRILKARPYKRSRKNNKIP